jgi:predicted ABC-type transport system involved in lysophospholipase L1 biosynthesis ATPase subunit
VADLLREACTRHGATLLMVCHQPEVAARFPTRVAFQDLNRAAGAA